MTNRWMTRTRIVRTGRTVPPPPGPARLHGGADRAGLKPGDVLEIPRNERLIVLEDAAELSLGGHPNSVRLLYSKERQGLARVSAKQLLEAALALEQLTLLVKESTAGREIARADIRALLDQLIDVVVQCGVEGQKRRVKEVYWKGAGAHTTA
jgi:type IV secretion system protein VirB11